MSRIIKHSCDYEKEEDYYGSATGDGGLSIVKSQLEFSYDNKITLLSNQLCKGCQKKAVEALKEFAIESPYFYYLID